MQTVCVKYSWGIYLWDQKDSLLKHITVTQRFSVQCGFFSHMRTHFSHLKCLIYAVLKGQGDQTLFDFLFLSYFFWWSEKVFPAQQQGLIGRCDLYPLFTFYRHEIPPYSRQNVIRQRFFKGIVHLKKFRHHLQYLIPFHFKLKEDILYQLFLSIL